MGRFGWVLAWLLCAQVAPVFAQATTARPPTSSSGGRAGTAQTPAPAEAPAAPAASTPPTTPAGSTPTQSEVDELARRFFEAGRLAFNDGRFADALNSFERAYDVSHRAPLLFNIATCHDRLREDQAALDTFRAYLVAAPDAANRREVEGRIAALEQIIASHGALRDQLEREALDARAHAEDAERRADENAALIATMPVDREPEIHETWWFWTIAGVVVVGAAVTVAIVATSSSGSLPDSDVRIEALRF